MFEVANRSLLPGPACGPALDLGPRGLGLNGPISVRLPCGPNDSGAADGGLEAAVHMFGLVGRGGWTRIGVPDSDGWVEVGALLPLQVAWVRPAGGGGGGASVALGAIVGCASFAALAAAGSFAVVMAVRRRRRRAQLSDMFSVRAATAAMAGNAHLRIGPGPIAWEDSCAAPGAAPGAVGKVTAAFLRPAPLETDGAGPAGVEASSAPEPQELSAVTVDGAGSAAGGSRGAARVLGALCVARRQALECALSGGGGGGGGGAFLPTLAAGLGLLPPPPAEMSPPPATDIVMSGGGLQCDWSHAAGGAAQASPPPPLPGAAAESGLSPSSPGSSVSSRASLGDVRLSCPPSPGSPQEPAWGAQPAGRSSAAPVTIRQRWLWVGPAGGGGKSR